MTEEIRVDDTLEQLEGSTGEPPGSPGTPSTGPLRGQAADAAGSAADDLQARLEAAEATAEQRLDDLRRLAAEFDNYRKRTTREQESLITRANERLVEELLPVLDDLARALEAAAEQPVRDSGPGEGARGNREVPSTDSVREGLALVHRSLEQALRKQGLAEVETNGHFDPHVHEALLSQPSEAEEGSIVQVVQKGYRLGDRVLRPARVVVAAPLPAAAEPPVRDSGPGEGARGNREVPPANDAAENEQKD